MRKLLALASVFGFCLALPVQEANAVWGKNGWGRNGWGKNGWGKNGWGKNGWGKNGWGKNGWGKNGYSANNENPTFLTDYELAKLMISTPLVQASWEGNSLMYQQLNHPPTLEFVTYLYAVACGPGDTFNIKPYNSGGYGVASFTVTISGNFDLARLYGSNWCSPGGVLTDPARYAISAAMLALENPFGMENMVSLRSDVIPMSDQVGAFPYVKGTGETVRSAQPSVAGTSSLVDSDWVGDLIYRCTPEYTWSGAGVATRAFSTYPMANQDTMLRVCPGGQMCDGVTGTYNVPTGGALNSYPFVSPATTIGQNDDYPYVAPYNLNSYVTFACPATGFASLQWRAYSSVNTKAMAPALALSRGGADPYFRPATEREYLSNREGAFYGDILHPKALHKFWLTNPVRVQSTNAYRSCNVNGQCEGINPQMKGTESRHPFAFFVADKSWSNAQSYWALRGCSATAGEGCIANFVGVANGPTTSGSFIGASAVPNCKEWSNFSDTFSYSKDAVTGLPNGDFNGCTFQGNYVAITTFLPADSPCQNVGTGNYLSPSPSGQAGSCYYDTREKNRPTQIRPVSAWQSSTLYSYPYYGYANYAIDGSTYGSWPYVTHTNYDTGAYLAVDLGKFYTLTSLQIYGRTDCCVDRLSNFKVQVSDDAANWATVYTFNTTNTTTYNWVDLRNVRARYLRVQLNGANYLSIAELMPFGFATD